MLKGLKAIQSLGNLKDALSELKLAEVSPEDALEAMKFFGFDNAGQISGFLDMARKVASSPDETVFQFFTEGGLPRLLNAKWTGNTTPPESTILQCAHCNEINFLT